MFEKKVVSSIIVGSTAAGIGAVLNSQQESRYAFAAYSVFCASSYYFTHRMIPVIKPLNLKAGMFGKDLYLKGVQLWIFRGTPEGEEPIPESMGIVPATIYLIFTILGIHFTKHFLPDLLLSHTSALLTIIFIILLGFADDVLELAWRYKLFLPVIATLPVIVAY